MRDFGSDSAVAEYSMLHEALLGRTRPRLFVQKCDACPHPPVQVVFVLQCTHSGRRTLLSQAYANFGPYGCMPQIGGPSSQTGSTLVNS